MIVLKGVRRLLSTTALLKPQHAFVSDQVYEKSINQVTLLGRVGTDPTVRGSDDNPLISFSLATNSYYKNNDDVKRRTDWHKIVVFRPYLRDNLASYLRKGHRVLVQGKLTHNQYQDSKGATVTSTSVVADDVVFMSSSSSDTRDKPEDEEIRVNE